MIDGVLGSEILSNYPDLRDDVYFDIEEWI